MPELPEVEVLARHLRPLLRGKTIRDVTVRRARVIRPTPERKLTAELRGATFAGLSRRGKFLLFSLRRARNQKTFSLLGHLGMTGRMFLQPATAPVPKHAAVVLNLGRTNFIYEDTRYFGRLTLDTRAVGALGPEPLGDDFPPAYFTGQLARSTQPIKVKLLDQRLVAGIGNIYASEALFHAGISPKSRCRKLTRTQVVRLRKAVRQVLKKAVQFGSTIPLDWHGIAGRDELFYYGRAAEAPDYYEERLQVYDKSGRSCTRCRTPIRRIVQAGRSTFYCPRCQKL